jgi:hypothetical protein
VVHLTGLQPLQDLVGRLPHAVGPVVQDDHGLAVVAPGFGRVLDNQHPVQSTVELESDVRVEEVGPGIRGSELIEEPGTGTNG